MKQAMKWIALVAVVALVAGCANQGSTVRTKQGAVGGAVVGAALGGIVGHQSGDAGEGAAVGALVGAAAGGLLGSAADERETQQGQ